MAANPMIYPVQPTFGNGGFDWGQQNVLSSNGVTSNFGQAAPMGQITFQDYLSGNPAVQPQSNGLMGSLSQAWQNNPMGVIGQGVSAFGTLASIYSGFKALDLAEDQFSFTKNAWNKNYNNQVKDYENTLKDRWAARQSAAAARGREFESMSSWVGDRRLTGKPSNG